MTDRRTFSQTRRNGHMTQEARRQHSGVVSKTVNIPKSPSKSFLKTLRETGADEGSIRRAMRQA